MCIYIRMTEVKDVSMDVTVSTKRRRRRTRKTEISMDNTVVEKEVEPVKPSKIPIETKTSQVIIAPAKPKILLVPKTAPKLTKKPVEINKRKTFKARQVHVIIDNTAKTQKKRRKVLADIDSMNEDTLRTAAVSAKLSRAETVAKVPIPLLRQLMKDYRMMRGLLV